MALSIGGFRDNIIEEASCFEARRAESGDGVSCGLGERCELSQRGEIEIEFGAF